MSSTYKATGINLKSMPMGEYDRLVTILTREEGLVRAIVPGARKHKSRLGGRSSLFVVNELLIVRGRSLDKVIQADTLESYPRLSQNLAKLTVSQYLAELVLGQALSNQPQEELFSVLTVHLSRLEQLAEQPPRDFQATALAYLSHGIYHLLSLAGVAPRVQTCCLTQTHLAPDFSHPDWRVGFSAAAGGTVSLAAIEQLPHEAICRPVSSVAELTTTYQIRKIDTVRTIATSHSPAMAVSLLTAAELWVLQHLAQSDVDVLSLSMAVPGAVSLGVTCLAVERLLRQYAQYHLECPIRSASLMDACFTLSD